VELNVFEWGPADAEPLVCLHGVTGHGERFKRLAEERWAATRRVLALDLRGHGRSGWDAPWTYPTFVADLAETADALGLATADWLGHSFGGRLVLELAAVHPQLVRRAILLDPAIQILPHIAAQNAEDNMREAIYADRDAYLAERLDPNPQTPRFHAEADFEQHCEPLADGRFRRRTYQPAIVSIYGEIATAPPRPDTLRAPALLLHAPAYGLVRPAQIEAYRASLGDRLRVVEVPGMHMVMWDAFDETADAVERFLAGT
jgi:lipase